MPHDDPPGPLETWSALDDPRAPGHRGAQPDPPSGSARLTRIARATATIAWKDLRIELRTREIVTTAGFFAILVTVLASVSFYLDPVTTARIAPGALWLPVAFASVLALGRTWQREREDGALTGLLVSPVPRSSIFLGKAIGVFGFVTAVECLVVPVVALLFHLDLLTVLGPLVPVLVLGTLGVASMGTLFGAMTVRTRARDLVLATVLFPLLSPTLIAGVTATREIFSANAAGMPFDLAELRDYALLLGVFDVIAVSGGVSLFGALLED
jgi:heme exporter protein B